MALSFTLSLYQVRRDIVPALLQVFKKINNIFLVPVTSGRFLLEKSEVVVKNKKKC
ncbi:MAG TPA: hypothetical protein VJ624_02840 [Thermodesulfobacteriota bacterium]|nr:hypothetical protein [Thermodesulfobacteriota bacterium]